MMKIILAIALFLVSTCTFSQTFTFTRTSPAVVQGNADTILDSYAHINNLTTGNITVRFTITNMIVPSGWDTIAMCTWRNCYPPGTYVIDEVLSPGEQEVHLYVYPYLFPGSGSCKVTASHLSTSITQDFGFQANPIGIHQISTVVKEFSLSQNYPNPFNPSTKINFSIPSNDYVSLRVFDILGREVFSLIEGELTGGVYEVDFNPSGLSSGIYIYSLRSGNNIQTKRMVLNK